MAVDAQIVLDLLLSLCKSNSVVYAYGCRLHWSLPGRNGKKDKKMYLLIFKCLSVKALHRELFEDMNAT